MLNIARFVGVFAVLAAAGLVMLTIVGALSSDALFHSFVKVGEVLVTLLVASVLISLIAKK